MVPQALAFTAGVLVVHALPALPGPATLAAATVPACLPWRGRALWALVALGALILGGAFPVQAWIHDVGIVSLWAAAALTLYTGYDYLRTGLRHMD